MTDSLLSRLQALTEPSREIDAEIALANGWYIGKTVNEGFWFSPDGEIHDREPPRFSASIDAALTLVNGMYWRLEYDGAAACSAFLWRPTAEGSSFGAHGTSPAIALLIAIVRAKEAAKQEMETKP